MKSSISILFRGICITLLLAGITSIALAQSGINLSLHYVDGKVQNGNYAYDISVFFSAFQSNGDAVQNLLASDLTITEDGKKVTITGLELTDKDPINVVVVMDISGSMAGQKMDSAKLAASRFISALNSNDLVSIMSFNTNVQTEIGFTNDFALAQKKVNLLNPVRGSGTCFYDALYNATQLTATLPSGRRAIIVLTDGVDELPNGNVCSKYLIEDVLNLAAHGVTRVPIYSIGLGNLVDNSSLDRLARLTGGRYEFASDANKLQDLFQRVGDQLRTQYRAMYVSTAAPGPHNLVLQATISGQQMQDSREFVLPNFPYSIIFVAPKSNEIITNKTTLQVQISGQGTPIQRVEFFVNDKSIGSAETLPYQLDWQPGLDTPGNQKIDAVALDAAGNELARTSQVVKIAAAVEAITTKESTPEATKKETEGFPITTLIIIGIAVLTILVVVVLILKRLTSKPPLPEKEPMKYWDTLVGGEISMQASEFEGNSILVNDTVSTTLGSLTVLETSDQAMVGQRIEITKSSTNLGRKADNDIIFPKDATVSRHHAVIDHRNGSLFLSEIRSIDDKGEVKGSSFGIFVNDQQLLAPMPLKKGDVIRLGKRVRLLYDPIEQNVDNEATVDDLEIGDFDSTLDN